MKNVAIMNSKQTKLGILDADVVKHIIDSDSTLYPDEVDRIDKFITKSLRIITLTDLSIMNIKSMTVWRTFFRQCSM